MISSVRLPLLKSDFIVLSDDRSFKTYPCAYGEGRFTASASASFLGNILFDRKRLEYSKSYDSRIPIDAYSLTVPFGSYGLEGNIDISIHGVSDTDSTTDSVSVKVFPPPETTEVVSSDAELRAALIVAKNSNGKHTKIRFEQGSYTFPSSTDPGFSDWDLSSKDHLVSFDTASSSNVEIVNSTFYLRWSNWSNTTFKSTTNNYAAYFSTGSHSFNECRFKDTPIGVQATKPAQVRLEGCVFDNLQTACIGVDVVRSCYWRNISKIVFQDVSRLIEGTSGYGLSDSVVDSNSCWALFSDGNSSPVIRNNLVVDCDAPCIIQTATSEFTNCSIVSNVFNSFNSSNCIFNKLENCYIVNNSFRSNELEGLSFNTIGRRFRSNYITNNYFTRLPENLSILSDGNTWDYNASEHGKVVGPNSFTVVNPRFANKYLTLRDTSPLRNRGTNQTSIRTSFGTLSFQNQVGAQPYHPDTQATSVLSNVLNDAVFGVTLQDSTIGDFVSSEAGFSQGGQLVFRDGTQSGWIAVVF